MIIAKIDVHLYSKFSDRKQSEIVTIDLNDYYYDTKIDYPLNDIIRSMLENKGKLLNNFYGPAIIFYDDKLEEIKFKSRFYILGVPYLNVYDYIKALATFNNHCLTLEQKTLLVLNYG